MIVANLATYPARRAHLAEVVASILGQVDRLNLVLNQYDAIPAEFAGNPRLNAILPSDDTRDTGKFLPDVTGAEWVFFIDDDILYPKDYVARTLVKISALPFRGGLFGYHGSVYHRPRRRFGLTMRKLRALLASDEALIQGSRTNFRFTDDLSEPLVVDQIATNTAVIPARYMPPYAYMRDSQRFVDVRLARWCHERGLPLVCLPHRGDWMAELRYDETIYHGFTRIGHTHVGREILSFALQNPDAGKPVRSHV